MSDIVTEHSGSILTIQLNRPAKKNAMTSSMYIAMADALHDAASDDHTRVVLWHGAGHSFTAGNDLEDFLKNAKNPPYDGSIEYGRLRGHCYTGTPDGKSMNEYWLPIMAEHITKTAPSGADLSWKY